ncbi:unnamed protein product [Mytilus coruscus]|uniref:YqaJ viral recombinase domain-containing protein n=1 Tax=Mytilus coruscus TaxID=42192 RepID=A0A6J8BJG2_MYTCO|nr:unnamed protein product [Mytilus coruscus]
MAGRCHSFSHVGNHWKLEHAVRNSFMEIACTDESAQWNKGTTRNVKLKALSNITFNKPKVGETVMENNEDYMPSIYDIPLFSTDAEFKAAVKNFAISKLFDIKGTTVNKSLTCTPLVHVIIQEEHGEQLGTKGQSSSVSWKDARKLHITASSATKVPIKDTTDATLFIREHLHSQFTRHRNMQEPVSKEHIRSLGIVILDTGMYVSIEEQWLSSSLDGTLNGDTLLKAKCPVPTKWNTLG